MVRYIKHSDIDKSKWDECISCAANGRFYVCSWYLDLICPEWDALVKDDYSEIMPLPVKIKMGVSYVFQPFYIPQAGVFSKIAEKPISINEFLEAIPKKVKFIDIYLNTNCLASLETKQNFERHTQSLKLDKEYFLLKKNYSESHLKNLRRAEKAGVSIESNLNFGHFLKFKNQNPGDYLQASELLPSLLELLNLKTELKVYSANSSDNEIIAMGLFVLYNQTATLLTSATSTEGVNSKAMFSIVDQFIKDHSGSKILLDFAGSSLEGVKYFNMGFGSEDKLYYWLKINKLPFLLKCLKK